MEGDCDIQSDNSLVNVETLKLVNKLEKQSGRIVNLMNLVNDQRDKIKHSDAYLTRMHAKEEKKGQQDDDDGDANMDFM